MKDFAARARTRKLKPDRIPGRPERHLESRHAWVREFAAIINPPHATILAVGR